MDSMIKMKKMKCCVNEEEEVLCILLKSMIKMKKRSILLKYYQVSASVGCLRENQIYKGNNAKEKTRGSPLLPHLILGYRLACQTVKKSTKK